MMASDRIGVADWLVGSLFPFQNYVAGSIIPPTYEACARILHPIQSASRNVSWADVAGWAGRIYHRTMQFEAIATPIEGKGPSPEPRDGQVPYHMPMQQVKALANLLSSFTATPEKVWYLVWEGYGDVPQTSRPRVQRPQRNYLLYCVCHQRHRLKGAYRNIIDSLLNIGFLKTSPGVLQPMSTCSEHTLEVLGTASMLYSIAPI